MPTGYSVNRIEIVIKVSIEFAAALRAFAAKLLQRRLEPSLLDSERTKSPLVDVSGTSCRLCYLLYSTHGPGERDRRWFVWLETKNVSHKRARPIFFEGS